VKFDRACHDAVQINVHHPRESGNREFAALVDYCALREDQDVKSIKSDLTMLERLEICHVNAFEMQAREIGIRHSGIIFRASPGSPNTYLGAVCPKCLRDTIPYPARSAYDENLSTREIELIQHRYAAVGMMLHLSRELGIARGIHNLRRAGIHGFLGN
jgi:hypothetical protein